MSKHHHQSKAEQIYNKAHGTAPFNNEKVPYKVSDSMKSEDIQAASVAVDDSPTQLRAYQIHREKGGTAFDNWLEAEQILKNNENAASSFISEGNPNTQK